MGNWRYRPPSRLYNQNNSRYDYEIPSDCLPEDNVPQWEKRFCYAVGSVPWKKVMSSKYFSSGHTNVSNWDDSAVEETFRSAKKRFWAEMNGLGSEDLSPPPGPDIYIDDDIDWDPKIDPELVKELDREYFAPLDDEAEVSNKLLKKFKRMRRWVPESVDESSWKVNEVNETRVKADPAKEVDENPWERRNKDSVSSKDNKWDDSGCDNRGSKKNTREGIGSQVIEVSKERRENRDWNENPWEQSNKDSDFMKDNKWDDSGGDNQGSKKNTREGIGSRVIEVSEENRENRVSDENPWERRNRDSLSEQINRVNGWGIDCDKDWGWNHGEWNEVSMNGNRWARSSRDDKDWGQWTSYRNQSRNFGHGKKVWRGNSSLSRSYVGQRDFEHYRDSRFRTDENSRRTDYWISRGNNKRRVSFQ